MSDFISCNRATLSARTKCYENLNMLFVESGKFITPVNPGNVITAAAAAPPSPPRTRATTPQCSRHDDIPQ